MQTWILEGSLGKNKGQKKIEREKTEESTTIGEVSAPFSLNGESHTLFIIPQKGQEFKLEMKSHRQEMIAKRDKLGVAINQYINDPDINEHVRGLFQDLKDHFYQGISSILQKTKRDYIQLVKPQNRKKPGVWEREQKKEIQNLCNIVTKEITILCDAHKLTDLSPRAVEESKLKSMEAALSKVQAEVQRIYDSFKNQFKKALPSGSKVKYRGSLATGFKRPYKLTTEGAVQFFNDDQFDCDIFIEVSPSVWSEILPLNSDAGKKGKVFLDNIDQWSYYIVSVLDMDSHFSLLLELNGFNVMDQEHYNEWNK